jgi:hypothetical protein
MKMLFATIERELDIAVTDFKLSLRQVTTIILVPLVIVFFYGLLLVLDVTRDFALSLRGENRPIELLTFGFLFAGGVVGVHIAWQAKHYNEEFLVYGFYAIFSLGLLLTAMEEISWGQWFFGFETPSPLKIINVKGELTIHNIEGLHGKMEFARVAFGLGGLFGVWMATRQRFRKIGVPLMLLSWFIVIGVHASLDLSAEYLVFERHLDALINLFSEFIEMMIGMAGFLYVWLNARKFSAEWKLPLLERRHKL